MPRFFRKIIRVRATDSPNVRLAMKQIAAGLDPTGEIVLPGVLTWDDYQKRLATWDEIRRTISLEGEFYKGSEVFLYPSTWLVEARRRALEIRGRYRQARAIGVDTAEGGDSSVWTTVDELGVIEQVSKKTLDTDTIPGFTIATWTKHKVDPRDVLFDRGGGGKQHADRLRAQGYPVRTVGFGEAATDPHLYNRFKTRAERQETIETRYEYKNRRAEMYGLTRECLDPNYPLQEGGYKIEGFAIPAEYAELHRQLSLFPLLYDGEGRMYLPPKDKPTPNYKGQTIKDIIGNSPDEADSLVLAVFAMLIKLRRPVVGAV